MWIILHWSTFSKQKKRTINIKVEETEHLSETLSQNRILECKDMFIADFLSKHQGNDTGSPIGMIPISCITQDIVKGIE